MRDKPDKQNSIDKQSASDKQNTIDKQEAFDKGGSSPEGEAFEAALSRAASPGIKPGLGAVKELLGRLGNPQAELKIIHVAGTNGKGSVCVMLANCLKEAGFRTGLYTSPHLMCYNERFRINGQLIGDGELTALLRETAAAADGMERDSGQRPTQFEILTAMAFLWFYRQKTDVAVLETGMGGRYDATNVAERPLLTVITNVSLDHEGFLGNTVTKIAEEKAGVIKAGVPLITAAEGAALDVIRREFGRVNPGAAVPFSVIEADCRVEIRNASESGQAISIKTPEAAYGPFRLPLPGAYQAVNLACVLRAWEYLAKSLPVAGMQAGPMQAGPGETVPGGRGAARAGRSETIPLPAAALTAGIETVKWPCRLELVQTSPGIILDGSHNPDGIRQLAAWLKENRQNYGRVILVMGMVEDKDRLAAAGFLDPLTDRVIITKPLSDRAGDWRALAGGFCKAGGNPAEFIEDCHQALEKAVSLAEPSDLVLCTGSFYLVGELRKRWKTADMF